MPEQDLVPALQASVDVTRKDATPMTPNDLLRIAVTQGADLAKLEKLMDLQERFEKNEARKAFDDAMARFKANPVSVSKNKHVKFGTTEYDHATLDHSCEQIIPALSAVGITHAWKPRQENGMIYITCVLKGFGHTDETTLFGPADNCGSKNPIQSIASTVTYLERYTLFAACGLAPKNADDDGRGGMKMGNATDHILNIESASTMDELAKAYTSAIKDALGQKDAGAVRVFMQAREKRGKELPQ